MDEDCGGGGGGCMVHTPQSYKDRQAGTEGVDNRQWNLPGRNMDVNLRSWSSLQ